MNLVEVRTLVDQATGEKVGGTVAVKLPMYFDPKKGYRMMARSDNVRVFPYRKFPQGVTLVDRGRLFCLSVHMWSDSGIIGVMKGRKFTPCDDDGILRLVEFAPGRKGQDWLKRMVRLSLLRAINIDLPGGRSERQWLLNPVYFCPMYLNRTCYLIWRDQIDQFIPQYVRSIYGE